MIKITIAPAPIPSLLKITFISRQAVIVILRSTSRTFFRSESGKAFFTVISTDSLG